MPSAWSGDAVDPALTILVLVSTISSTHRDLAGFNNENSGVSGKLASDGSLGGVASESSSESS